MARKTSRLSVFDSQKFDTYLLKAFEQLMSNNTESLAKFFTENKITNEMLQDYTCDNSETIEYLLTKEPKNLREFSIFLLEDPLKLPSDLRFEFSNLDENHEGKLLEDLCSDLEEINVDNKDTNATATHDFCKILKNIVENSGNLERFNISEDRNYIGYITNQEVKKLIELHENFRKDYSENENELLILVKVLKYIATSEYGLLHVKTF